MRKTYKYRIYLTKGQRRLLEQQLELCRWVSNETLAERKRAYEERGESLSLYKTQAMLPVWKFTMVSKARGSHGVLTPVEETRPLVCTNVPLMVYTLGETHCTTETSTDA